MKKILLCGVLSAAIILLPACSNNNSEEENHRDKDNKNISKNIQANQNESDIQTEEENEKLVSFTEIPIINDDELTIILNVPVPFEVKEMNYSKTKVEKTALLNYKESSLSKHGYLKLIFDGEIISNPENSRGNIEFSFMLYDESGKEIRKENLAIWDVEEGEKFTISAEFSVPSSGKYTIKLVDED